MALGINTSWAGVDIHGNISKVWLARGNLYFGMKNTSFSNAQNYSSVSVETFCKKVWAGLNFYVPVKSVDFPYYYGLITSANAKGNRVLIANVSIYDGSAMCDITRTNYGIVVYP